MSTTTTTSTSTSISTDVGSITPSSTSTSTTPSIYSHLLFDWLIFRILALCLTMIPFLYIIYIFTQFPYLCYLLIVIICCLITITMMGQTLVVIPAAATGLIVGGYNMNMIPIHTFIAICGFFAIVSCLGLAIMSAFVGSRRSSRVQEICMLVGIGAPITFSLIYFVTLDSSIFHAGLTCSLFASFLNIYFNKSSASVGVPLKHSMIRRSYPSDHNLFNKWAKT